MSYTGASKSSTGLIFLCSIDWDKVNNMAMVGLSRASLFLSVLTISGDTPRNQNVTVYRGTGRFAETQVWNETGLMMYDFTRTAYLESDNIKSSLQAGIQHHANLAAKYGSEINLAKAQSLKGTEFPFARSMFSVSTNYAIANQFAGVTGHVYSAVIDRRLLLASPLNKTTGNEAEYFIRVAYPMRMVR